MNSHAENTRYFVRLTPSQRLQHIILVVSTSLLIITGWMVQAEAFVIQSFGNYGDTVFWLRGWIHRIAGATATAICVYHIFYVIVSKEGQSWFIDMMPRPKDLLDVWQNISYMLGFRERRPKMDRFFYLEKLEYWSVWFGMTIVIVTGIMLWTEFYWPEFFLRIASAFHLGEATLATLAIIVGHVYAVHYNAHVYPMNTTFIDGMISEHLMKEEHGMQYERELAIMNGTAEQAPTPHGELARLIDDYRNCITYLLARMKGKPGPDTEETRVDDDA